MSPAPRRKLWLRRTLLGLLALTLLYAIAGALVSAYYKRLVLAHLPALAAKATDSLYDITVQDVRVNIFTRAVTVTGLRMSANLDALEYRRKQGRPPHVILEVSVPEAEVAGVHWRDLKNERELGCRHVTFRRPEIRIQVMPWWHRRPRRMPRQSPVVSRVFASRIVIDDPQFDVRYSYGRDAFMFRSSGGRISAEDWDFHPGKAFDTARFFAAREAELRLDNVAYFYPGALYQYELGSIAFSTRSSQMSLSGLHIQPAAPYDSLYARLGHRKTFFDLELPRGRLEGLRWRRLLAPEHALVADRLTLDTPRLRAFLSKRPPPNPQPPGYFPSQWLQRLTMPLHIRQLSVWDGSVEYGEANALTGATGSLPFSYLRGSIFNITNMPAAIAMHPECSVLMTGNFAYRARLATLIRFSLRSRRGAFSLAARLQGLEGGDIREAVSALAMVEVKSLELPVARVDMAGNEDSLWGRVAIEYRQLRLKLKKWNEQDSALRGRPLLNFFANNILLYDSNPAPGDSLRLAEIGLPRGHFRSFFQFVWKGIAQGCELTAIREGGALDMAKRHRESKGRPRKKFFKKLFPKRADSNAAWPKK
jgi:hypothetical protein